MTMIVNITEPGPWENLQLAHSCLRPVHEIIKALTHLATINFNIIAMSMLNISSFTAYSGLDSFEFFVSVHDKWYVVKPAHVR